MKEATIKTQLPFSKGNDKTIKTKITLPNEDQLQEDLKKLIEQKVPKELQ